MNCDDVRVFTSLYLTGELDARSMAEMDAHVAGCPECARALRDDQQMDVALRASCAGDDVAAARIQQRVRQSIGGGRQWWLMALKPRLAIAYGGLAVAVVAVMLFVISWRANSSFRAAALDHYYEVVEGRQSDWHRSDESVRELAALRLGRAKSLPTLARGYRLERVRVCNIAGHSFLHLVYINGSDRFSVFLRQGDAAQPPELRVRAEDHELQVASFRSGDLSAYLVSQLPASQVRSIAADIKQLLQA